VAALDDGALKIYDGTTQLADNSDKILSGSAALTDGAEQISDGASKLADGSVELGDGLTELGDGSDELKSALSDGADQVNDLDVTDEMLEMIAAPVDAEEVYITEVANNGHAMSAYMMSVALWVGCIAFCIMYPLMKHEGKIRSGFDWWLSKATVLFTIAIGMALVMLGMLHVCNGFDPANWKQMIVVACLASIAFMSIMYFFNVFLGKVGSFLMLIFMVIQLSGAAGTYPIELSGDFVAKIHSWLPFSYTVDAFRVAICGSGSIANAVTVLAGIIVVFTLLTIGLFQLRTKESEHGRKSFYDMLEERGLA
jgi:putative membrane protein